MTHYAGGAHLAKLIALDGAGNRSTREWTINVDPSGHITADEATATLEALEETTEEQPVAPTSDILEPEQIAAGANPKLEQTGAELVSSGVADETRLDVDPSNGFSIESPDGVTEFTPVVAEAASATRIAREVAGVAADIGNEADSVVRPEYNGVDTFQAIRSSTAVHEFSWSVGLTGGQTPVSVRIARRRTDGIGMLFDPP